MLAGYERDHYIRGGQHDKGWRKIKPLKKTKARRAFRKASNDHTRSSAVEETTPTAGGSDDDLGSSHRDTLSVAGIEEIVSGGDHLLCCPVLQDAHAAAR